MGHRFPKLALALALAGTGVVAANQFDVPLPPAPASRPATLPADLMAKHFADLASPDPSSREAARVALMDLPRSDLPAFEALVRKSVPLAPAQANALREIVVHAFLAGERYPSSTRDGFLGVKLGEICVLTREDLTAGPPAPLNAPRPVLIPPPPRGFDPGDFEPPAGARPTSGVVILERMLGFCGSRAFLDGDIVLAIVAGQNHLPVRNPGEMRNAVLQYGAGQRIRFQVLRQGQFIAVDVRLDPRPDVNDPLIGRDAMEELLIDRRLKAETYWGERFAPLVRE